MRPDAVTRLFPVLLLAIGLGACGIDDYIYLDPVTDTDWRPSDQRISFTLPSDQNEYFDNYVIYYRLYPSSVSKIGIAFTTGDFSSLNTSMYSDYSNIYPYSTEDDEAPVSLEALFTKLGYKELSFGTSVATKDGLGSISGEVGVETLLTEDAAGKTLTIDFNLSVLQKAHPSLILDGTAYRILRENASETLPSRDFLYYASMKGGDFEGNALANTYAVFYIVAKGTDLSFSTILSRAAFLGALQLPAEPSS